MTKSNGYNNFITVSNDTEGNPYLRLGARKRITIKEWKRIVLIDFREYFTNAEEEERPGKKGISLTEEQWKVLKASMETIDQAINKMKEKREGI
jgi:hypothetical protein